MSIANSIPLDWLLLGRW